MNKMCVAYMYYIVRKKLVLLFIGKEQTSMTAYAPIRFEAKQEKKKDFCCINIDKNISNENIYKFSVFLRPICIIA